MMAAVLVLCFVAFFIVVSSVAYAYILVSTCAACIGFSRTRLLHVLSVNSGSLVVKVGLHCPALMICFGCHFFSRVPWGGAH